MFDEMDRLHEQKDLYGLLQRYQELGKPDRQLWQDRVQDLDGVEPRLLVRLHGELLAHGWIEQNTGVTPNVRRGMALSCYRITAAGVKALKELQAEEWAAAG